MKKLFLILLMSVGMIAYAQEQKEITPASNISDVTVFIKGAQITRNATASLPVGKVTLRFKNLSPYVDAKSVQVKIDGDVMLHSVNYQLSYDTVKLSSDEGKYQKEIAALDDAIKLEQTKKSVIDDELNFLKDNRKISGNDGVEYANLKNVSIYYSERLTVLKTKDLELDKKINDLSDKRAALMRELSVAGTVKPEPKGEIVITLESKKAERVPFVISYFTSNAGWNPSYDIRAKSVTEPVELAYKANIMQNTKEDWKNVKLKVSSANPNQGNVFPQLKTYYLDYYTLPPRYSTEVPSGQVRGIVRDEYGDPVIGASIYIEGRPTIGTITNLEGQFDLTVPTGEKNLLVNSIGMKQLRVPISGSFMNLIMEASDQMLDEVVVTGAVMIDKRQFTGAVGGVKSTPGVSVERRLQERSTALPVEQTENVTSVEFEIKTPYTILSENKSTTVEVERYALPAEYEYFCIPKIDRDAFLLANISDWEQYSLLEGEANIFFENTFVGKTIMDVRYAADTLNISLGRDKGISIQREKAKEYTTKKFLGSKAETTQGWHITVKNNKRQPINLVLLDQIPVSTLNEIEVSPEELSGGELNNGTGEVKWRLNLPPAGKQEVDLRYKVKYPKDKNLNVE